MQNETLRQAHIEMEASRDRYVDLYDFSPVSYLTLGSSGTIFELNLTAPGIGCCVTLNMPVQVN